MTFLEKDYKQTLSEDIGALLGGMRILKDEKTADPAPWEDWINCVMM